MGQEACKKWPDVLLAPGLQTVRDGVLRFGLQRTTPGQENGELSCVEAVVLGGRG